MVRPTGSSEFFFYHLSSGRSDRSHFSGSGLIFFQKKAVTSSKNTYNVQRAKQKTRNCSASGNKPSKVLHTRNSFAFSLVRSQLKAGIQSPTLVADARIQSAAVVRSPEVDSAGTPVVLASIAIDRKP